MLKQIFPGDLIYLKKYYQNRLHPDGGIFGLVISSNDKNQVLFTEKCGVSIIEALSNQEIFVYYQILKKRNL